jgi:hypothetical protein
MNDFFAALLFPDEVHVRSPDPGPSADHKFYKAPLQQEFRHKCVYCRTSDGIKGDEGFGVDHYHPRKPRKGTPDPAAVTAWENLFYACNVCNSLKGNSESTPERFLPNPCEHPPSVGPMAAHLQYRGADVEPRTRHGAWMSALLRLHERRQLREFVLSTLKLSLAARTDLLENLAAFEELRAAAGSDEERDRQIQETEDRLAQINRNIERLTGEPVPPRAP